MKKESADIFAEHIQQEGFTLLEVIVAIAILSIGIAMVMQLFAGGLRTGRISKEYTNAVIHAKAIMEEKIFNPAQESGEFPDGLTWQAEITPYEFSDNEKVRPVKITVKIYSHGTTDACIVELATIKIVKNDNEI